MAEPCLLIGDIGGTNARFALANPKDNGFSDELTLSCADYETADEAIAAYLASIGPAEPSMICLACAGPVADGAVDIINNHWEIDSARLRTTFPNSDVLLLNDFEAIAYSIPLLTDDELMGIGPVPMNLPKEKDFTIAVVGPGTGLGIGGLLARNGAVYPITGEGGHAGFAPETPAQHEVVKQLKKEFERVSNERMISGPGLENIYRALGGRDGAGKPLAAAEIFSRVLAKTDPIATAAVQMFFKALGQIAGNLVLTIGAYDGVFLAGGILKRYPNLLKVSNFRVGFENKGRHRGLMENVPVSLILHPQPGLLGASERARAFMRSGAGD